MSDQSPDSPRAATPASHEVTGAGSGTRVDCPTHGEVYGPHPDSTEPFRFCPYCGNPVDDEQHDAETVDGEVFCEVGAMSTYRYCPGCGVELR